MLKKIISALMCTAALCAVTLNAAAKGYGQGREVDENNRPLGAIMFNDEFSDYGAYAMLEGDKQGENQIVLTFDQGYENGYTKPILDALGEKGVKAVFFVTGDYAKRNPDLVRRMIDEGHIIGNHGMKHASLPKLSPEEMSKEITSLHDYVKDKFDYEMKLFRPPCGEYSEQSLAEVQKLGYRTLLWSFAYKDWEVDNQPDCGEAFDRVTEAAHSGAVYLLHSVSSTNAEILPRVIDCLREKGYEFALPDFTE